MMEVIKDSIYSLSPQMSLIVALILFSVVSILIYYRHVHSYWERKGIKGPKPVPLFGTMLPAIFKNRMELDKSRTRDYGKVYGLYQGASPQLMIADAELIRQIMIKDFDTFPNHEASQFLNKYQKGFLFFLQDQRWKHIRSLMSTTFTSGKIKRMYKLLDACANDLIAAFEDERINTLKNKNVFNIKEVYNLYTMDAIATCCYGMKLNRENGTTNIKTAATRNDFVRITYKIFNFRWARFVAVGAIPNFILKKIGFSVSDPKNFEELALVTEQILRNRRVQSDTKKFDDYLQLLIEANSEDKLELSDIDLHENHHAGLTHESLYADQELLSKQSGANTRKKVALTDPEILSGTMFLLAVGLETTSTLLTNSTYALAFHQDVQERLYQEVLKIAEWNEDKTNMTFEYEALTSCKYLDAVISETLRALAPITQIDRFSSRDYFIEKCNLHLPKHSKLVLGLFAIMNNPDYWPEPSKFNPERFMPENRDKIVPGSYCPFGLGPRHCLGMRFSLTEAKLALAKMVMIFKFESAPDTAYPPTSTGVIGINKIDTPVVRVIRREHCS